MVHILFCLMLIFGCFGPIGAVNGHKDGLQICKDLGTGRPVTVFPGPAHTKPEKKQLATKSDFTQLEI
jgi:hypothetical protein